MWENTAELRTANVVSPPMAEDGEKYFDPDLCWCLEWVGAMMDWDLLSPEEQMDLPFVFDLFARPTS